MVYDLQLPDIVSRILAGATCRFFGVDVLKLFLPKTQQGYIYREMIGYFLDGVVESLLVEPDRFFRLPIILVFQQSAVSDSTSQKYCFPEKTTNFFVGSVRHQMRI